MSDLDPQFTVKVEFPFKALFAPDDVLAQWIANLGRAVNDLLLANRRLAEGFENRRSGHEVIYDIRAVGAHAWELLKFLDETDAEPVDEFLKRLISKARTDYDNALGALQAPEPDAPKQEKAFKAMLASARDQASHYSEIDHKLLKRALERLGEDDEDGQPNTSAIYIGQTFKDSYSEFGTELDYQLFCEIKGTDTTRLREFVVPLNDLVGNLVRFATTAIHTYLYEHENELRVTDLRE